MGRRAEAEADVIEAAWAEAYTVSTVWAEISNSIKGVIDVQIDKMFSSTRRWSTFTTEERGWDGMGWMGCKSMVFANPDLCLWEFRGSSEG